MVSIPQEDKSSASDATLANSQSVGGAGAVSQAGMEAAAYAEIAPGSTLGQYKIIEKIGEGGMGLVFKATDTTLERTVALKVMYCDPHEDQKRAQRFIREARAMARLSHPNLLHVYSVGSHGPCHYFAMELLRGETLSHAIRRLGKIPVPDMMHYGVQIIAALFYVHHNGIIHRDIKSGNIMLCGRRAVLMDFGLAKEAEEDAGLTSVGAIMGTPDYMPPEAAEGRTEGPPTDIYSLGVVLYEALGGRLPFLGKSAISIIRQHIDSEPPPLESLVPEIKPELAEVIHRCMAKKPQDRYADCPALAAALWDLLPEQGLLDVAERRLADADSMPLEQTQFGNLFAPGSESDAAKLIRKTGAAATLGKTGTGRNKVLAPTLTGIQNTTRTSGGSAPREVAGALTEADLTVTDIAAEERKGLPQWVWAVAGFAGVFVLLIALAIVTRPPRKEFKGQPVLRELTGAGVSERDVLLEFKSNDPDPKNWYFVVRRAQADGSMKDLRVPYREYVPQNEDVKLQFLSDDVQKKP